MRDRGVSTVVSYVLTLGIVAILTSSLLVSFAPFVTTQTQDTTQSTMGVFGNDVAGDIDSVDRLATAPGENKTAELRTRLPDRVGGSRYEIEIAEVDGDGPQYDYEITLRAVDSDASAVVRVRTQLPVEERTGGDALDGGDLLIAYDPADGKLVIRNA